MFEDNPFPDYVPKRTPDTIFDYGFDPNSKLHAILSSLGVSRKRFIPSIELDMLKQAIDIFNEYIDKAKINPGKYEKGNMILGAPREEYIPSEEALIASEIGKLINFLINNTPKEKLEESKKKSGIKAQKIAFTEIYFTHTDVMGSGRFFYAVQSPEEKIVEI